MAKFKIAGYNPRAKDPARRTPKEKSAIKLPVVKPLKKKKAVPVPRIVWPVTSMGWFRYCIYSLMETTGRDAEKVATYVGRSEHQIGKTYKEVKECIANQETIDLHVNIPDYPPGAKEQEIINAYLTLEKSTVFKVLFHLGPDYSESWVRKVIKKQKLSPKVGGRVDYGKDPAACAARVAFSKVLAQLMESPQKMIVFIDETGISLADMFNAKIISPVGERVQGEDQRIPKSCEMLNVLIAATRDHVVTYSSTWDNVNAKAFDQFFENCLIESHKWIPSHLSIAFVMDNSSVHNGCQAVIDRFYAANPGWRNRATLQKTSPHSPDLNLVECINGRLKSNLAQTRSIVGDFFYLRPKKRGIGSTWEFEKDKCQKFVHAHLDIDVEGTLYKGKLSEGFFDGMYNEVYRWTQAYIEAEGKHPAATKLVSTTYKGVKAPGRPGSTADWRTGRRISRRLAEPAEHEKTNRRKIFDIAQLVIIAMALVPNQPTKKKNDNTTDQRV